MRDDMIVEIFGEGVTDIGDESATPVEATEGVVVILVARLCRSPENLRVKKRRFNFLQGKGLWQKVHFAKQQAFYNRSHGAVFVMDSEGGKKELKATHKELCRGRDFKDHDGFPMAVGVAHPCIEAWLLCDADGIRRAMKLPQSPMLPDEPESLPAPRKNPKYNPKEVLEQVCGAKSAAQKHEIARRTDWAALRTRCPLGLVPFTEEVEQRLAPLFEQNGDE